MAAIILCILDVVVFLKLPAVYTQMSCIILGSTEHIFTSSSLTTEMRMRNGNSKQLLSDLLFMTETLIMHFLLIETSEAAQQD